LCPGGEVRLRYAYVIKCYDYVKDPNTGEVVELRCSYYEGSRGGKAPEGKKIKGTIHWVSKEHACPAEIRLYDRLFVKEDPLDCEEGKVWLDYVNPESLVVVNGFVEPSLKEAKPGSRWQFERLGYFCVDSKDSSEGNLVFNRIVSLKDTWAKLEKKMQEGAG
jgi:glutaminyl-tRNA synthetase